MQLQKTQVLTAPRIPSPISHLATSMNICSATCVLSTTSRFVDIIVGDSADGVSRYTEAHRSAKDAAADGAPKADPDADDEDEDDGYSKSTNDVRNVLLSSLSFVQPP